MEKAAEGRCAHTHVLPKRTFSFYTHLPERLLEVIVSEMYGVGSRAMGGTAKREQRRQGRREVKKEEAGARGGCMLIGAKWAADELKWFAM